MKPFTTILFATDFSESSEYAFDYAQTLVQQSGARLVILHVINEPVDLRGFYVPHISFEKLEEEIRASAEQMLASFCAKRAAALPAVEAAVVAGIPYDEIIRKAHELDASLIVLGTHGRTGLDHVLFGSTAEKVVRKARCPVLTVRLPAA